MVKSLIWCLSKFLLLPMKFSSKASPFTNFPSWSSPIKMQSLISAWPQSFFVPLTARATTSRLEVLVPRTSQLFSPPKSNWPTWAWWGVQCLVSSPPWIPAPTPYSELWAEDFPHPTNHGTSAWHDQHTAMCQTHITRSKKYVNVWKSSATLGKLGPLTGQMALQYTWRVEASRSGIQSTVQKKIVMHCIPWTY